MPTPRWRGERRQRPGKEGGGSAS